MMVIGPVRVFSAFDCALFFFRRSWSRSRRVWCRRFRGWLSHNSVVQWHARNVLGSQWRPVGHGLLQ